MVRAEGLAGSGVTVHQLGLSDRPVLALEPRFARRAARLVNRQRFDIVHGVGGSFPGASIITAQYCQAAWREARDRYQVRESSLLSSWYHALLSAQAIAYERRAYGHPALRRVIAVSQATAGELTAHYGVPSSRVSIVPNGVDPDVFDSTRYPEARSRLRHELGLPGDTPLALLIGTYARKGLDTAIAAAARASDALHLVVAGSGDDAAARRAARDSGLGERRLHLLGPRAAVAPLYAAADLFVLPTRYEPFGMVIVEAMSSGLPVVVSGCSGAAELITPGESGLVVAEPDDTGGFAAALRGLLADPARRAAMGRAACAAAQAVAWPRIAEQTEAAYHRAAQS